MMMMMDDDDENVVNDMLVLLNIERPSMILNECSTLLVVVVSTQYYITGLRS